MSSKIDQFKPIPKYYQLAAILRQNIENDVWKPRSPIPSERKLEVIYNVSRTTIRKAINFLVRQGYLYREHGRGTFVSPSKIKLGLNELTGFSEDLSRRGMLPGQIIQSIKRVIPPERIREVLELDENCTVLQFNRIRLGDGFPIALETCYANLKEEQVVSQEELEETGSLYRIYEEKFNLIPFEADQILEVTIANPDEADLLEVEEGAPLLLFERLSYSQNRTPLEFVKILCRGDRYRYYVHLTKNVDPNIKYRSDYYGF